MTTLSDFTNPEPPKARPKPGLSGQAGAGTSLIKLGYKMEDPGMY